jgi:hypothetical protein
MRFHGELWSGCPLSGDTSRAHVLLQPWCGRPDVKQLLPEYVGRVVHRETLVRWSMTGALILTEDGPMLQTVNVVPMATRLICSRCGAEGAGSCSCGATYVPPGMRAAAAPRRRRGDRAPGTQNSDFGGRRS